MNRGFRFGLLGGLLRFALGGAGFFDLGELGGELFALLGRQNFEITRVPFRLQTLDSRLQQRDFGEIFPLQRVNGVLLPIR